MSASAKESTESSSPGSGQLAIPPVDRITPQFTLRAVLTGMILGALLSCCNVYTGLKIGWGSNMSITAALMGYGFWLVSQHALRTRQLTILESNINQTVASSAAAISSAGLVAPIPALALLTGETLTYPFLVVWVFSVCLVGITVGIALRRQLVLEANLPFPSGIATLQMLREIYSRGAQALQRIAALGVAAVAGATANILKDSAKLIADVPFAFKVGGMSAKSLTFLLESTTLMYAVGGLVGIRAGVSVLVGGLVAWGVVAPAMVEQGKARLSVSESLVVLPEGIELPPQPMGYAEYDKGALRYQGVMTEAERDGLLAQSDIAAWQTAVWRLFVRSQVDSSIAALHADRLRSTTPMTKPPTAPLPSPVTYDAESESLVLIGSLSDTEADALRDAAKELPADERKGVVRLAGMAQRATGGFAPLVAWLLWPGVSMMVVSSLTSFAFSIPSMIRSFSRRGNGAEGEKEDDPEGVPARWFAAGLLLALVFSVLLQVALFQIVWWTAILGVMLTFVLAMVAARVAGETNITPVGAMGKVTQLLFGVITPGQAAPNLMAANVTGGAASQCADLMFDYKTGLHLGASPRWQSVAQIVGALAGSVAGSGVYFVLVRDPVKDLLSDQWPAPAVATWKAVAELFVVGIEAMPEGAMLAALYAGLIGFALAVIERFSPKKIRPWIPSAASLGLAFVIPMFNAISMFLGALTAWLLGKFCKDWSTRFLITICAGLIAGHSLSGVGISVYQILGDWDWKWSR